jgi:N-acetylmuramoyl-L-alanine amidase
MLVTQIVAHEASFDAHGRDTSSTRHALRHQQVAIPGTGEHLAYVEVRPKTGDRSYYTSVRKNKDQIVLHFTEGFLRSDVAALTHPNANLSVPFLLGRNGTVYNLFPTSRWAYHLGPGAVGGNRVRSPATLGIELSNVGPLTRSNDHLVLGSSATTAPHTYCALDEQHAYVEASFRGYTHYATFTDAQIDALAVTLRYLLATYDIPARFLHPSQRYETLANVPSFRGIVTHVNYRSSKKVDLGPAFRWKQLIAAVDGTVSDRI